MSQKRIKRSWPRTRIEEEVYQLYNKTEKRKIERGLSTNFGATCFVSEIKTARQLYPSLIEDEKEEE